MLFVRYYLWIVPHLLCGVAAAIAVKKKVHRDYPAFVWLLVFDFVFELCILWAVGLLSSLHTTRWFLVFGVVAGFALELLVLQELLGKLAISRQSLERILQPLPRWTAAILILLAVLVTASLPQTTQERVMQVFVNLNLGLNIIAAGLLLAMLLFAKILGLRPRSLTLGVALGLGITAAAEIATSPLVSLLGRNGYITVDVVRMAAFHVSTVVWLVYILMPTNRPRPHSTPQLFDLEQHADELQRMMRR